MITAAETGEIGDIVLMRAYRQAGPVAFALVEPKPDGISELMYQIQKFHGFLWATTGPTQQTPERVAAMTERHVAAIEDLESFTALGV